MSQSECKMVEVFGVCGTNKNECFQSLIKCAGVHPCRDCVHKKPGEEKCGENFFQIFWNCGHYREA